MGLFLIQLDPCGDKTEEPVSYWQKSATVRIQTPRFGLKAAAEFNLQREPVKSNVYFEMSNREMLQSLQVAKFLSCSDIPAGSCKCSFREGSGWLMILFSVEITLKNAGKETGEVQCICDVWRLFIIQLTDS